MYRGPTFRDRNPDAFRGKRSTAKPFDPLDYGAVLEHFTARALDAADGAAVPTLPGALGDRNATQAVGSAQAEYVEGSPPALAFDGDDFYQIDAGDQAAFDVLHAAESTIVVRFQWNQAGVEGEATALFDTHGSKNAFGPGIYIVIQTLASFGRFNHIGFFYGDGSAMFVPASSLGASLTTGWHVLGAHFRPLDNEIDVYFDGELFGTVGSAQVSAIVAAAYGPAKIGSLIDGVYFHDGQISDVICYTGAVSDHAALAEALG